MSAAVFGASDVLAMSTGWEPQGSDGALAQTHAEQTGSTGDVIAETTHNPVNSGSCRYIYKGDAVAFVAAIEAAAAWPGMVKNSLIILGVAIDYSLCAQGKRPVVAFQYRNGPTASARAYKTTLVLPTYIAGSVKVPDVLTVTLGGAETINAQWGLGCGFGEDLDKDGAFLAGEATKGQETLALTYAGTPTSITSTGWQKTAGISSTCPIRLNTGYGAGGGETFVRAVTLTAVV
jgi:hypothetical protein